MTLRTRSAWLAALFCTLLLAGCRTTYFGALNAVADPPSRVATTHVFDARRSLSLDVYTPDACNNAPVVVFFYGGSWQNGERAWYRFVGEQLATRGMLVVIPDYRKSPETPFPGFIEDAARAVAFSRKHAAAWCGDPDRLFVAGHSAGAHVAGFLAIDADWLKAVDVDASKHLAGFIGLSGPYDFLPIADGSLRKVFVDPARDQDTQPIRFVNGDEPPALLVHGTKDRLVWPRNSENLHRALQSRGIESELMLIDDIGHTATLNTLAGDADELGVIRRIEAFVAAH